MPTVAVSMRSAHSGASDDTPIVTGLLDVPPAVPAAFTKGTPVSVLRAGFRAELDGASLWDLVQMECMGRSCRVVQVTGEGGIGYLYFAGGRVVHAVTPHLAGEAAALEILNWTNGAFQPCERAWPASGTIDAPPESLLLRAAKRRDDAAASNLVAFPARITQELSALEGEDLSTNNPAHMPAYMPATKIKEEVMTETRIPTLQPAAKPNLQPAVQPVVQPAVQTVVQPGVKVAASVPTKRNDSLPDFAVMLRIGPNGAIVKNKGGTEEFAGVVAYTHRLVELVGNGLGLDSFVAMECTFKETGDVPSAAEAPRCLLFTEANGDTVALRPRAESNIQPLRESLGL